MGDVTDLETDPELEHVLREHCERLAVPGASAGVLVGGRLLSASYGVTDVEHPIPVDADTLFLIGSTTKTLTATALMTLVQDDRLSLDDRVVEHLPELVLQDEQAREAVTVGQLLDHTSGWRGDVDQDTGWGDDALQRAVAEGVAAMPQVVPVGEGASYSNTAVIGAGRLLEVATGQRYDEVVRERVLEPLGMTDTWFFPWDVATRALATGHVVRDGVPAPTHGWPIGRGMAPAGGAVSSVRDQLAYARFHVDGTCPGEPPLADELRLLMQQPRVTLPAALSGIGVSWLLRDRDGLRLVTHGGNCSNLYLSSFALAPDEGFAVTVLANSRGGAALGGAVTEWAVQHHLGLPPVPARDPLPLAPELAAEYVGRYDAGQWDLDVTADGGRLFVQLQLTDIPADTPEDVLAAFDSPPAEYVLLGPDVIAPAGTSESSGDFIRDADGRVMWLRQGLRMAHRR